MSSQSRPDPPDQPERMRALDSGRSILVQAPAGSGKTDLLARRFLRLLGEVDEPGKVVAITFTNAAAAEMRNRILDELRKAETSTTRNSDEFSMEALARLALEHSQALGWKLIDLPAQLRVRTIDSFCRELALQQPLLSGLGGGLNIGEQPEELYRRAAREALRKVDESGSATCAAIEELLQWRDNDWKEMEEQLVEMLKNRDRWMQDFVLQSEKDWEKLRERLERPFAHAVRDALDKLSGLLDRVSGAREEALELARFACEEPGENSPWELAECADFPAGSFPDGLKPAHDFFISLSDFLQTQKGSWRTERGLKTSDGFPSTPRGKAGKARFAALIAKLAAIPGLEFALAAVRMLPSAGYTEEEWKIVKACFTLLREAVGELHVVFAEAGAVDFTEVAQIAQRALRGEDNLPTEAAMGVSDKIRHLLVDEFQDTSRRQHQLLSSLIAAWPEREGRSCFVVGDPMQSIYFFRDADAELFPRVKALGLEIPNDAPQFFDSVSLTANFRTTSGLVAWHNQAFKKIFAADDGSGITFAEAQPARETAASNGPAFELHLEFVPQTGKAADPQASGEIEAAHTTQIEEIVAVIQRHQDSMEQARQAQERGENKKFRVAVLGRAKNHLVPIAQALREAGVAFRAVELEKLAERPEVLDALALARALLNPEDRVAWLGVLRAPWCGLSLEDLHRIAGSDEAEERSRPIPELIAERLSLLSEEGRLAAAHVLETLTSATALRAAQPTASLGSWLEEIWLRLGGAACVDATGRANLDLLWSCLDNLMGGEPELVGPGLAAALDKLTAQPDPKASDKCGVQLMTIHKSKGLEFEVVIVPELQARIQGGKVKMLTWLERGLERGIAEPDESGEITEFLVAPLQRKREEKGSAKAWVDGEYRKRESQEDRRILYVAATRAREELHLFARPAYTEKNGELALVEATNSLLAKAWPALEEEVGARFEEWKAARAAMKSRAEEEIESIAASGDGNLAVLPAPIRPTLLRHLPPDYHLTLSSQIPKSEGSPPHGRGPARGDPGAGSPAKSFVIGRGHEQLYTRHEGGMLSRARGRAVHTLLEELARLRARLDWEAARSALRAFEPRIAAQARAAGVDRPEAARIAAEALQMALRASHDPTGSWILRPHADAASEAAWAGIVAGGIHSVRVDRVFRAGPTPGSEEGDCWWIIDYKSAQADNPEQTLPGLRELFAPQLEAYAGLLRNLHGGEARVFAGLYYPRLPLLDWWEI